MPPPNRPRRAVTALERGFPFEHLSEIARQESYRKEIHRPLYHVHKWWATRLGSVFRAMVLGANLPAEADLLREFYRPQSFDDCIVLDPFMGSGTTVGEALKLGCRVVGADINPISSFQVQTVLQACSQVDLSAAFQRLERRVAPTIRSWYQSSYQGEPAEVLYAFWVKQVPCPDCGAQTRLFDRWVFASHAYPRRHPQAHAVCPKCGAVLEVRDTQRRARCTSCGHRFDPQSGPATRLEFCCEACGRCHRILQAVRSSREPPAHQMYALMLLCKDGRRVYKQPDAADLALYGQAGRALRRRRLPLPDTRIPAGHNTDQARQYNYRWWRQMFNDRQLLALGELLRGIQRERDEPARDALLLLFSGVLEFNNLFCTFKGEGTGAVRHLFAHHVLRPPRTPLEANPWGTPRSSGSFSTLYARRLQAAARYCAEPTELSVRRVRTRRRGQVVTGCSRPLRPRCTRRFEQLVEGEADALVLCGDSSRLPLADHSVDLVITDPPYFDNVHYSELADFFHAWLRVPLGSRHPGFRRHTTRNRREVQGATAGEFGKRLGAVLVECVRVLQPDGLLAFTFHHSRLDAWEQLARAVRRAALQVTAAHPVVAEMRSATPLRRAREPIQLDLVVVCRPGTPERPPSTAPGDATLRRRTATVLRRFRARGIGLGRGDVRVVVLGQLLQTNLDALSDAAGTGLHARVEQLVDQLEG